MKSPENFKTPNNSVSDNNESLGALNKLTKQISTTDSISQPRENSPKNGKSKTEEIRYHVQLYNKNMKQNVNNCLQKANGPIVRALKRLDTREVLRDGEGVTIEFIKKTPKYEAVNVTIWLYRVVVNPETREVSRDYKVQMELQHIDLMDSIANGYEYFSNTKEDSDHNRKWLTLSYILQGCGYSAGQQSENTIRDYMKQIDYLKSTYLELEFSGGLDNPDFQERIKLFKERYLVTDLTSGIDLNLLPVCAEQFAKKYLTTDIMPDVLINNHKAKGPMYLFNQVPPLWLIDKSCGYMNNIPLDKLKHAHGNSKGGAVIGGGRNVANNIKAELRTYIEDQIQRYRKGYKKNKTYTINIKAVVEHMGQNLSTIEKKQLRTYINYLKSIYSDLVNDGQIKLIDLMPKYTWNGTMRFKILSN